MSHKPAEVKTGRDELDQPGGECEEAVSITLTSAPTLAQTAEDSKPEEQPQAAGPHEESTNDTSAPDNALPLDTSDAGWLGRGLPIDDARPYAAMSVGRHSTAYKMNHKRRGLALVIVYEHYGHGGPGKRDCAQHDAFITKNAFKHLGFEIEEHRNPDERGLKHLLRKAAERDHSNNDALAVIFMSHGGLNEKTNREFIWTYDSKVETTELWKNFTAGKCPSLAGKPKMFFIQACRGEETDKGVQLKRPRGLAVATDSFVPRKKVEEDYVIPLHADMLMMWASYPGMFAFKSGNSGINGSVFLHFLSQVILEDSDRDDLATLLLRVTREVAVQYESYVPQDRILNQNKQIPYTVSTLMRKVYFCEKYIS